MAGATKPLSLHVRVNAAIERGVEFLLARRETDRLWRDFRTRAGLSSDWVSSFITRVLFGMPMAAPAARETLAVLMDRQHHDGGWGYNGTVPSDCDSTSWTVLSIVATDRGLQSKHLEKAREFVSRHQSRRTGAFSTYAGDSIARYIGAPSPAATLGWTAAHACVSGVALQALLASGASPDAPAITQGSHYLRLVRNTSDTWASYWWTGSAYATYHALKALQAANQDTTMLLRRARAALALFQNAHGAWSGTAGGAEPFETAFSVLTLLLEPHASQAAIAASRGVRWLLRAQTADGGWPSFPMLRIPPPMSVDADSVHEWYIGGLAGRALIRDEQRQFTTAAVLWALEAYRNRPRTDNRISNEDSPDVEPS